MALFNDEEAYEKLFFHFNEGLYKLAFSFVKSPDLADEIVSDAFINLWRNRSRLTEIDNLRAYLYVSVKNLSIKQLTRTRKNARLSLDDLNLDVLPCSRPVFHTYLLLLSYSITGNIIKSKPVATARLVAG